MASIAEDKAIIDACIIRLADALNAIHGMQNSTRYWETIVASWVYHFVMVLRERYVGVRAALEQNEEIAAMRLDSSSYVTHGSSVQLMVDSVVDDRINLQFYSLVLESLNVPGASVCSDILMPVVHRTLKRRCIEKACYCTLRLALHGDVAALIGDVSVEDMLRTPLESSLRCRIGRCKDSEIAARPTDTTNSTLRRVLQLRLNIEDSEFSKVIDASLPVVFPTAFVEDFAALRARAQSAIGKRCPRILITSSGYHTEDLLRVVIAESRERGSRLVIAQHGGDYGSSAYSPLEDIERRVADEYWGWGWAGDAEPGVRNVPSIKLSKLSETSQPVKAGSILYVANQGARYYYRKHCFPTAHHMREYMEKQFAFFALLSDPLRGAITVRPYPKDYGWRYAEQLRLSFPTLKIDNVTPYNTILHQAHLVLCDMNLTTLLERAAIRKPLICYLPTEISQLRPRAVEIFEGLRSIGMFYDDPAQAAQGVEAVYPAIDDWWESCLHSKEYAAFVATYALASKSWHKDWWRAAQQTIAM